MLKNHVTIIGYVGFDPEKTTLPNGKIAVRFSVATSFKWVDKLTGEQKEKTEWHTIKAFDKFAEILLVVVKKGAKIAIGGRLTYDTYEDKKGSQQVRAYIIAEDFDLFSPKPQADTYHRLEELPQAETEKPEPDSVGAPTMTDDLPF